jgi:hypothetical protein
MFLPDSLDGEDCMLEGYLLADSKLLTGIVIISECVLVLSQSLVTFSKTFFRGGLKKMAIFSKVSSSNQSFTP